jgi:hypothetical protein
MRPGREGAIMAPRLLRLVLCVVVAAGVLEADATVLCGKCRKDGTGVRQWVRVREDACRKREVEVRPGENPCVTSTSTTLPQYGFTAADPCTGVCEFSFCVTTGTPPTFKKCLLDDPVITVRAPFDLTRSFAGLDFDPDNLAVMLGGQRVHLRCIAPGAPCLLASTTSTFGTTSTSSTTTSTVLVPCGDAAAPACFGECSWLAPTASTTPAPRRAAASLRPRRRPSVPAVVAT